MTNVFGLKMLPSLGGQLFHLANTKFSTFSHGAAKNDFNVNIHITAFNGDFNPEVHRADL